LLVGLEADECYYIQTPVPPAEPVELNLKTYPPPDLAIEVEVSRGSLDKVSIYGRLGVGEVWRWTGDRFVVLVRQTSGAYIEQAASACLPDLPMEQLGELTRLGIEQGQPAAVRALRDRLRSA
jgi:Uma2 family endonuclease